MSASKQVILKIIHQTSLILAIKITMQYSSLLPPALFPQTALAFSDPVGYITNSGKQFEVTFCIETCFKNRHSFKEVSCLRWFTATGMIKIVIFIEV